MKKLMILVGLAMALALPGTGDAAALVEVTKLTASDAQAGDVPTPTATPASEPRLCGLPTGLVVCPLPISQTVFQGTETTVEVAVDGVPGLGAFQVTLSFDPAVIFVVDAIVGTFLGSTGRTLLCIEPPPEPGARELICVTLGTELPGPSGSGVLAVFTLRGEAPGLTTFSLQDVSLTDIEGLAFPPPSLVNATVSVVKPPTPPPTPTPTPCLPDGLGEACDYADDDNDGCSNIEELGPDPELGGQRNPNNFWDFFDPNLDGVIDFADLLLFLQHFYTDDANGTAEINRNSDPVTTPDPGPGQYHPTFDRTNAVGTNSWDLGPGDGTIGFFDLLSLLRQYGHDCTAAP